jgi:hypothetical protein
MDKSLRFRIMNVDPVLVSPNRSGLAAPEPILGTRPFFYGQSEASQPGLPGIMSTTISAIARL